MKLMSEPQNPADLPQLMLLESKKKSRCTALTTSIACCPSQVGLWGVQLGPDSGVGGLEAQS